MYEDMDLDLPFTQNGPGHETFLNRKKNTFKQRRESCPTQFGSTKREQVYFQRRFGIKTAQDGVPVQDGMKFLSVDNQKHTPKRSQGFSDYVTPVRVPHHSSVDGSPMEVDSGSPEMRSQLNTTTDNTTSMFSTALWSKCDFMRTAKPSSSDTIPNPYSVDQDSTKHGRDIINLIDDEELEKCDTNVKQEIKSSLPRSSPPSPTTRPSQPHFPPGKSKKAKCLKFMCYCNIMVLILILAGILMLHFAQNYRKGLCVKNQQFNVTAINESLQKQVYGQHIMFDMVIPAIEQLMTSPRTLVLSFHGWTGIGKTYVSTIISNHIVTPSVHKIIIPLHFPHIEDDERYKDQVYDWILTNISACAVNVFIIDEMDKATPGVIEGLVNVLSEIKQLELNTSRVLIILLSNTGGAAINRYAYRHLESGYEREQLIGSGLIKGILNDEDAEWLQLLYNADTIDHIVPFLPLERIHVKLCIKAYIKASPMYSMDQIDMEAVLDEFLYVPKDNPIFSKIGCRKVNSKVDLMINFDYRTEL